MAANADRGGFLKDDSAKSVRTIRRRQDLEEVPGPSLLHLDRQREDIEGAGGEEFLRHITEILGCHVVDIRFDNDNLVRLRQRSGRTLFSSHQPEAIRKLVKLLRTGTVADLVDGKTLNRLEAIHNGGQNRRAGRRHQLCIGVLLVNRRVAQQVRGRRGRDRQDSVLAVNEAASDVDRGAQKPLDAKGIEANRGAHRIDDRVYGAHLVKLHVFGWNVMNLALGYRQLGEDVRGNALRIRIEIALLNHFEDFRRLSMEMSMTVAAVVMVIVTSLHEHIEFHGAETRAHHPGGLQFVALNRQLLQFGLQVIEVQTQVQQRTYGHVTADSGKAIEVQGNHMQQD